MELDAKINCHLIDKKTLDEQGFNLECFSYYVKVSIKKKNGTIVFPKCKAIEMEGQETIYFTENSDKNLVMFFFATDNKNTTIEKLFLN